MVQAEDHDTDADDEEVHVKSPKGIGIVDEELATKLELACLCDRRTARKFLRGEVVNGKVGDRLRTALAAFRIANKRSRFPG